MAKKGKNYIIEKCFDCYVKNGIEATTTRDFCAETGVNINTLYRIFGSKDNILTACVNYGFSQLENTFFDALKEFDKSSFDIFPELVKIGMDFAPKMRFLHQAISSPLYESRREVQFKKLNAFYDRFGRELAMRFDCPYELIRDYIYEIMTLLSYFSLWGSADMAALQFSKIFLDFKNTIIGYRQFTVSDR